MKQVVIISGKGGTGKTVVSGAFAALAKNKVLADCDVDAADLHLLLKPRVSETHEFKSGKTAFLDSKKCVQCGKCEEVCRFGAITFNKSSSDFPVNINPISCEGCSVCAHICPVGAIEMRENLSGHWYISDTNYGFLVHAKLGIAEENSGKLVTLVREKAKEIAEENELNYIIIDGSPGIGCPVIASLSGSDLAIVVTEPTLSGLHDLKRVLKVTKHFGIKAECIINKFDLNLEESKKIEKYVEKIDVKLLGKIPFSKKVSESVAKGIPVTEYMEDGASKELKKSWNELKNSFKEI